MKRYQKISTLLPAIIITALCHEQAGDKYYIYQILENKTALEAYVTAQVLVGISLTLTVIITAWALLSKATDEQEAN